MLDLNDPANMPEDPTRDIEIRLLWEKMEQAYLYARLLVVNPEAAGTRDHCIAACDQFDIDYLGMVQGYATGAKCSFRNARRAVCSFLRSEADKLYDQVEIMDYNEAEMQKRIDAERGL